MNEDYLKELLNSTYSNRSNSVSIHTKKNGITYICVKAPGFAKEDLTISFDPNTLELKVSGYKNVADVITVKVDETIIFREDCKMQASMWDGMLIIEAEPVKKEDSVRKIKIN